MKGYKKAIAIILSTALVSGITATSVYAVNDETESKKETETTSDSISQENKNEEVDENAVNEKEETVYVFTDKSGDVNKIIVSDWIKNNRNADEIEDVSNLNNIENVKGDEEYSSDNGIMTWNSNGNDIYYQGEMKEQPAVDISITYTLDGKSISAEKLAGKSGKVTIRYDFTNNEYELKTINGKQEKIYVPFAMITGMVLSNDSFSNVEVTNGKIVNDGDRTIVMGYAFPGLSESLGLEAADVDIDVPEYFEITADVNDFSLESTITIASNSVFNELDKSKLDSLDELKESLNDFTEGFNSLLDGSSQLNDGLAELLESSEDLVSGIGMLSSGADKVSEGSGELNKGAIALKNGADELSVGLEQLAENNDSLTNGAKQIFESLILMANSQIKESGLSAQTLTIDNYSKVLGSMIDELDDEKVYDKAYEKVSAEVENKRPQIEEAVTNAVKEQVEAKVSAQVQSKLNEEISEAVKAQVSEAVIKNGLGMSTEEYEDAVKAGMIEESVQSEIEDAINKKMNSSDIISKIDAACEEKMKSDEIKSLVESNTDAQMSSDEVKNTISENVELKIKSTIADVMASDEVQNQLSAASEGAKSLISLKTSLDSYNAFYLGLNKYTQGVASASEGADKLSVGAKSLSEGISSLDEGAKQLSEGAEKLNDNMPALTEGIGKLKEGSQKLYDGMLEFDEKGIQKISNLIEGDYMDVCDRLRAAIDVSNSYNNFSGISESMNGTVKYIYKTEEIK